MLGWLWLFVLAVFANGTVMFIQFWQVKNADNLTLFGVHFSSLWTFWTVFSVLMTVVYLPINVLFFYLYWYGYTKVFPGQGWYVQETFWLSALVVMFFVGWLFLGELPAKNALVALFFLACAFVALVWR